MSYFKTIEEYQAFIEAQKVALVEASKKINKLEEQNQLLTQQVQDLSREIQWEKNSELESSGISHSEMICLVEIEKLKNLTTERALTYDETKRLEIFHKILGQIALAKKNKDGDDLKSKSTDELLKELTLIEGGDGSRKMGS